MNPPSPSTRTRTRTRKPHPLLRTTATLCLLALISCVFACSTEPLDRVSNHNSRCIRCTSSGTASTTNDQQPPPAKNQRPACSCSATAAIQINREYILVRPDTFFLLPCTISLAPSDVIPISPASILPIPASQQLLIRAPLRLLGPGLRSIAPPLISA